MRATVLSIPYRLSHLALVASLELSAIWIPIKVGWSASNWENEVAYDLNLTQKVEFLTTENGHRCISNRRWRETKIPVWETRSRSF